MCGRPRRSRRAGDRDRRDADLARKLLVVADSGHVVAGHLAVGPRTHLVRPAVAADPARTDVGTGARAWVAAHADLRAVSARYERLLRALADTR